MKGLLKIGLSTRPVLERSAELSAATGVPSSFEVEAYFVSNEPEEHEKQIHEALREFRVKGKEFFEVPLARALDVVRSVCGKSPIYTRSETFRPPGWKSEYDN